MEIYIREPLWHKVADVVVWTVAYSAAFGAGLSMVLNPPSTIEENTSSLLLFISGIIASASAMGCLVGVTLRKLVFERVFIWGFLGGFCPYPIAAISLAFGNNGRYVQAFALTMALGFILGRVLRITTYVENNEELKNIEQEALSSIHKIEEEKSGRDER